MPADTEIRRARPEEWPVYRQVRLTALAEAPYAFMSTLEREQGFGEDIWRQRLGSPTAATFLAWRDGEPARVYEPEDWRVWIGEAGSAGWVSTAVVGTAAVTIVILGVSSWRRRGDGKDGT